MTAKGGLEAAISLSTKHLGAGSICPPIGIGVLRCYSMKYCPYAQRTRLVLLAKNIRHEIININLKNKPEWFFEKNPLGKVPVLEKNGQTIYESLITCDYLEEVYPDPPLYPTDPWKKAQDRAALERFSKVITSWYKILFAGGDEETRTKGFESLYEGLDIMEAELKKRDTRFYGGDKPGMLDYMIWPWAERFAVSKEIAGDREFLIVDRVPLVISWTQNMLEDPVVKAAFIPPETYIKYRQTQQYDF